MEIQGNSPGEHITLSTPYFTQTLEINMYIHNILFSTLLTS